MPILKIADARRLKHISQEQMASVIGCSHTAYRNKEKYRTLMNANEIADFLLKTGFEYEEVMFTLPKSCHIKDTKL